MTKATKVYIVILNWNGWGDTIECLESLLRTDYPRYHIVVVDNGSSDGSLERIGSWLDGRLCAVGSTNSAVSRYRSPVKKPIEYIWHDDNRPTRRQIDAEHIDIDPLISIIPTGRNLGFAGGNNVGIRFALSQEDCSHIWLLNNDTTVQHDSLDKLMQRMQTDPLPGICGSTLLYYDKPDLVQALGGARYYKCFAFARHLAAHSNHSDIINTSDIEKKLDYVVGASMIVRRDVLEKIGILDESYFLYCEEIDFCRRAKKHFTFGYAPESIVFHKEGASTGASSLARKRKSNIALYHAVRSRLLFTGKFHPWCLPTVYLSTLLRIGLLLFQMRWQQAGVLLKLLAKPGSELNCF